ncbi:MAG: hypothetical protein EHM33_31315 [Chloroflexi bacterium]|nr:MAG: hypothetical protein EHM33_31315 [Chloroflexota bacterium]
MKQTMVKKLFVQRASLLKEVAARPGFIRGSLIRTTRAGKDGTRREFRFLSRRIAGVNHSTYVTIKQVRAFEAATRMYRQTAVIIEKICTINIRIIRAGGKP